MHLLALVCVCVCVVACGCGTHPRVDQAPDAESTGSFPLKLWMTANLARPMKAQDLDELGRSLSIVANSGAPGLARWEAIAERGVRAAADGDVERVRQSCSECHEMYRQEYREHFRSRPFPFRDTRERSAQ